MNISFARVVWVFGPAVKDAIQDITPTRLTSVVLSKLREADYVAQKILSDSGYHKKISQVGYMVSSWKNFLGQNEPMSIFRCLSLSPDAYRFDPAPL